MIYPKRREVFVYVSGQPEARFTDDAHNGHRTPCALVVDAIALPERNIALADIFWLD